MPIPLLAMLAGMGQGMDQAKERELERKKLEMGLTLLDQQAKDLTRKNKLIEQLLGVGGQQEAAPQEPPQTPGPFKVDSSLRLPSAPPQMNGGQNQISTLVNRAMENDPQAIAQVEALKLAGVDLGPAIGIAQKNREFGVRQQEVNQRGIKTRDIPMPGGETYEEVYDVKTGQRVPGTAPWPKKGATFTTQQVTLPDGSVVLKHFKNTPYGPVEIQPGQMGASAPALGGTPPVLGGTGGGGGTQLKPSERDMPIPEEHVQMYRGPNGEPMPSGLTPKQAAEQGYRKMTADEISNIAARKQFTAVLDQLDSYAENLFTAKGPWDRLLQTPENGWKLLTQSDPDLVAYDAFAKGTLAPMIRAVGEKGNLSEGDIQRGHSLIPKTFPPDTGPVAARKLKQLRAWFENAIEKAVPVQAAGKTGKPSLNLEKKDKLDEFREPGEPKGSDLLNKQRYKSPEAVREAYRAKKIDRDQAKQLLKGFGIE